MLLSCPQTLPGAGGKGTTLGEKTKGGRKKHPDEEIMFRKWIKEEILREYNSGPVLGTGGQTEN